jgi:hypothetical protein
MYNLNEEQEKQTSKSQYLMLEARNFFNLYHHTVFCIFFLTAYLVVTVFTVRDYFHRCKAEFGEDFHFSDCTYGGAVTRTMVFFSLLPIQIFAVQILIKFAGKKQNWLSVVKIINHFVIVFCIIDTEHGMTQSLLNSDTPNSNMECVLIDMIFLIIIDIPDLPFPFDIFLLSGDASFLLYKAWNSGHGAQSYHIVKSVFLLLLCIWYMSNRENAKFNIQKILY